MFEVTVSKNQAILSTREPITSGSVNAYLVQFNLSEEWDSLVATAVFKSGSVSKSVLLDDTRTCFIPWEVMDKPKASISIGVYGTKGTAVVLPTTWATTNAILEGVTLGDEVHDPTPDVYTQLSGQLADLNKKVDDLASDPGELENPLPAGGTTGQVLTKASDADHDVVWKDVPKDETTPSVPSDGQGVYLVKAPIGTIVIWSGSQDEIPSGWQLCDGTNGTPDLRDKFVLGAGNTYAVGDTGGQEEVTLGKGEIPMLSHKHKTTLNVGKYAATGTHLGLTTLGSVSNMIDCPSAVPTEYSSGVNPHNNMPPYYALCYIMKLMADETDGPSDSSSDGEVYSTEETRIGMWTNGKPLYRKVVTMAGGATSVNISELNCAEVYIRSASAATNSQTFFLPYFASTSVFCSLYTESKNTKITATKGGAFNNTAPITIILEYTKTTD